MFLRLIVIYLISVILSINNFQLAEAILRRCYQCRSRGDLGDCKDPFKLNVTDIDTIHGVSAIPCASGWCGKVIEGEGSLRDDDYDMATQRMCVQRGPSDSEDRCAYTVYNYKKVYMCFCQGDLCNSANTLQQGFNKSSMLFVSFGFVIWTTKRYLGIK